MNTHVIILAQGRQERMGEIVGPKQLLPLPACNNVPILHRTLVQLAHLLWDRSSLESAAKTAADTQVTVVGWPEVFEGLRKRSVSVVVTQRPEGGGLARRQQLIMLPEMVSLADPGNSSLKGIHRYLESIALTAGAPRADRTMVLLGDVVYSWFCLSTLLDYADFATPHHVFAGTSDISPAGGEIWGVAWTRSAEFVMLEALDCAVSKHPPYQAYQPGQLRRWMWALHPSFQTTSGYVPIDDYTMDVDLPEHVPLLQRASELAAADDWHHEGLVW